MKVLITWLKKYRVHLLAWATYIGLEQAMVLVSYHMIAAPFISAFCYTLLIGLFYSFALIALPWALKNKAHAVWRIPFTLATAIFIYLICLNFGYRFFYTVKEFSGINSKFVWSNGFRALYFMVYATGYYYLITFIRERKRSEELERQRLQEVILRQKVEQELTRAQNAFLKAQINPHFLFNTLDFIYHNILELSPLAADAVISLTEMMRYAIDADKGGEFILLGDEIDQVNNLQYLNRLRKRDELPLKLSYAEEVRELNFIPLVLLTLTENIFKHGNLLSGNEATMQIYIDKGLFTIETDNVSSRQRKSRSSKTGLINIEKRLKYAYGDSVYFYHEQTDDGHFKLQIKIPVQQLQQTGALSLV